MLVDVAHPRLPRVVIDNVRGGELAAEHLLARGHRRIGFVGDHPTNAYGFTSSEDRRRGFQAALGRAGVRPDPALERFGPHGRDEAGELAEALLRLPEPPSAIFAASDLQAIGVLKAAERLGVRVPEDLAVIGFDDVDLAEIVGLTTIRQPLREGGALAADLLLAAIEAARASRSRSAGADGGRAAHDVIEAVLSAEGWPYASAPPVEPGDPGRFHALFGRDCADHVAAAAARAAGDRARDAARAGGAPGRRDDPATLEEPGKIGHEFRDAPPASFVAAGWPRGGEFRYYGTADATPGSSSCWTRGATGLDEARPRGRATGWRARSTRAAGWSGTCRRAAAGSSSRAGATRSTRRPTRTAAATCAPTGRNPEPPLADADTQAVAYAALRASARMTGDAAWTRRADALRARLSASASGRR